MSRLKTALRRPAVLAVAGVTLVAATVGTAVAQAQPAAAASTALYIVQVAGAPLASYQGGDAGYAATKPAAGHKLDAQSATAQAYRGHLRDKQTSVLREGVENARAIFRLDEDIDVLGIARHVRVVRKRKGATNQERDLSLSKDPQGPSIECPCLLVEHVAVDASSLHCLVLSARPVAGGGAARQRPDT